MTQFVDNNAELPDGWAMARISQLMGIAYGKAMKAENRVGGAVPVYGSNGIVGWHDEAISQPTVIIGRKGSVGAINRSKVPCWPIDTTFYVREFQGIDATFALFALEFLDLGQHDASTAIPGISREDIYARTLRLPPLAEQKRIVAKVEELLGRVNAARARLAKVPTLLKRFRQSVLAAACSGRLTEDWRTPNPPDCEPEGLGTRELFEIPTTWQWIHFGEIVSSIRSGSTVVPKLQPTAFAILRSSSVRPGEVDLADVRYVDAEESNNDQNFLTDGDLLFTRLSGSVEYVANCAVVRSLGSRRIQYPDRLFRVRLAERQNARYVEYAFAAPFVRKAITELAKSSAGHQRVSQGAITDQAIPMPPLAEQREIVRRVDALFALADKIEARVKAATARVEKTTQAILAKAFRGELIPTEAELARQEGRHYEPASALLERIRKQREAEPDTKACRKQKVRRSSQRKG